MSRRHQPITLGSPRSRTADLPGVRISDIWFPPDARLPRHTHDRAVFAVTLAGCMDTRIGSRPLASETGWVWTEPAGESHDNRVGPSGARVVALLPDPAAEHMLAGCGDLLDGIHHLRHGGVADLARRMAHELRCLDDASRLTLQGLALECLGHGVRGARGAAVRDAQRIPAWLARARDLVHDRFRDALEIADVAREVGVEPGRLAREFRRHFREPLGAYQRRLRLARAIHLLAESDAPLSDVALEAGFYDQSHLTRHFRRYTGDTPGAYRSRVRRG